MISSHVFRIAVQRVLNVLVQVNDWTLEFELLLCVARKSMDPETAARVDALLAQPIDWELLLAAAQRHGLAPLLYKHLNSRRQEMVPAGILERLRLLFRNNAARNLLLTGKLCEILELLDRHGIPAIPFKGPALAQSVYGDLALRVSFDLDVLVHRRDVWRAGELLQANGFQPEFKMTPRQWTAYLKSQCELIFNRDADLIHLEIQWAIVPRHFSLPLDLAGVWQTSARTRLGQREIPLLPPEEGLMVLCIHGAKHLWDRLLLVCDVAELLRNTPEMDWSHIFELARKSRSRRVLFLGLFLASEWLGAPLPPEIHQQIHSDQKLRELADRVRSELDRSRAMTIRETVAFQLHTRECRRDRVRIIQRLIFEPTSGDWERMPLPDFLFPIYYLTRPLRVATKYAAQLWRTQHP